MKLLHMLVKKEYYVWYISKLNFCRHAELLKKGILGTGGAVVCLQI